MVDPRVSSNVPSRAESEGLFIELRVEVRISSRISLYSHSFKQVWPSFAHLPALPPPVLPPRHPDHQVVSVTDAFISQYFSTLKSSLLVT